MDDIAGSGSTRAVTSAMSDNNKLNEKCYQKPQVLHLPPARGFGWCKSFDRAPCGRLQPGASQSRRCDKPLPRGILHAPAGGRRVRRFVDQAYADCEGCLEHRGIQCAYTCRTTRVNRPKAIAINRKCSRAGATRGVSDDLRLMPLAICNSLQLLSQFCLIITSPRLLSTARHVSHFFHAPLREPGSV